MEIEQINPEIKVEIKEEIQIIPQCEKNINRMFWITLLPSVNSKYRIIKYGVPVIINLILGGASMCLFFYSKYYPTQGEIWTIDIIISWISYNYMIYLFRRWDIARCFESIEISKSVNIISLIFYYLYLVYWLYFAVIQFNRHNDKKITIQLGNILMSTAWFIFFCTMSVLYYFICIKLSQRSKQIRKWLKNIKEIKPQIGMFYIEYNNHYKLVKELAKYWNVLIFIGSVLLTFHIPIDLISIIYNDYYYDIFGLIIKLFSLLWYVWRICDLNDNESYIVSYLHKHRIFTFSELEEIEKYVVYRPLGLNFYGIKINKPFIIKLSLITLNLIIPTLYGLISNKILK